MWSFQQNDVEFCTGMESVVCEGGVECGKRRVHVLGHLERRRGSERRGSGSFSASMYVRIGTCEIAESSIEFSPTHDIGVGIMETVEPRGCWGRDASFGESRASVV